MPLTNLLQQDVTLAPNSVWIVMTVINALALLGQAFINKRKQSNSPLENDVLRAEITKAVLDSAREQIDLSASDANLLREEVAGLRKSLRDERTSWGRERAAKAAEIKLLRSDLRIALAKLALAEEAIAELQRRETHKEPDE